MSVRNSQAQDDIDLMSLFGALRRSLPRIIIFSVLAGALTYGVLSMMAPRYTSEAQIAIASKRTNPFPEKNSQSQRPDSLAPRLDREAINTHVQALGSPTILLKVAEQLELAKKAEFNPAVGPVDMLDGLMRMVGLSGYNRRMSDTDRVIDAIKSRLEVSAARESRFISISFSATDPKLAAGFANGLAETYRKTLVDVPVQETNDVVQALMPKIEQLNQEVVAAEAKLERFRAKTDRLLTGPQLVPLSSQRLNALSEELVRAEGALSQAEARWRTARDLTRRGSGEVLPEVQQSNVIQGLINQRVRLERQVNEASASLLPAHPRMKQLNADLRGLKRSIASEVNNVVLSLEKGYRSAQLRVNDIASQMKQLKTRVADTSDDDAQVKILEARAKSKRAELDRLQRQLEDNKTLVVTKTVPVEAQIVSAARASGKPTFPKKGPISALVAAATFLLGLAVSAASEIINRGQGPATTQRAAPVRGRQEPVETPEEPAWQAADDHIDDYGYEHEDDEIEDDVMIRQPSAASAKRSEPKPSPAASVAAGVAVAGGAAGGALAAARRAFSRSGNGQESSPASASSSQAAPSVVADRLSAVTGRPAPTAMPEPQPHAPVSVDAEDDGSNMAEIAAHVASRAEAGVGYRTMIVGESDSMDPSDEALQLIEHLAAGGARAILIDCSLDGQGLAASLGIEAIPGLTDLVAGHAGFEDVVTNLDGTTAHVMACGSLLDQDDEMDADACNLVLDALDEAYDHIVVTGHYADAKTVFEAIQGRFDAGVTICDQRRKVAILDDPDNSFLGFEVTDIDVIRYERSEGSAFAMRRQELAGAEADARS